jgi:putative ABC transport system permease protein
MFGRTISPFGYVAAVILTAVFSVLVNGISYFSLRRIDMIESLKSVE